MSKYAVIGYGVVGSGTVELFETNRESITKKIGREVSLGYILDLRDFPDSPYQGKHTKDFNDILNDPEVEAVAEVIGGIHPAFEFTKQLLEKGKSVVTSNKELVAQKGAELFKIAKEHNASYLFEASVGGGIPIIRPLHKCLAGNKIEQISGILNGTTNFILTKMIKDQMSFDDALKLAQKNGFAEADPTADVEGQDACRKICILASLVSGSHIYPDEAYCEGITQITPEDVEYAQNAGYRIKLIGSLSPLVNGKLAVMVCPRLIPESNLLSHVDGVYNAISVTGNGVGDVIFYGQGAGKLPTASAVVGDLIDALVHRERPLTVSWDLPSDEKKTASHKLAETAVYVRAKIKGDDAKAKISAAFDQPIFIERKNRPDDETAFITSSMQEAVIDEKLKNLGDDIEVIRVIRAL
ncbi:MAG: homoserine dehydrogenase [Ruminococcus sp.]|nr:homoserine dehydrogenase [Ruminococcus sp.]